MIFEKFNKNLESDISVPEYTLIKMRRRTLSIKIKDDLSIEVKAPKTATKAEIDQFLVRHIDWIKKTKNRIKNKPQIVEEKDINVLKNEALKYLTDKTRYYSEIMHLYPTDIKITSAKTRFGSCSSHNSICYSYRLMLYPEEAREYVVVHEIAHIKYKNHGKEFYKLIESILPDYKNRIKLLK